MKIRMLRNVMEKVAGQVYEVTDDEAKALCLESLLDDGSGVLKTFRKAMPEDEAQKLESAAVDMQNISQGELAALGKRNVVPTPPNERLDSMLKIEKTSQNVDRDLKAEAAEAEKAAQAEKAPAKKQTKKNKAG